MADDWRGGDLAQCIDTAVLTMPSGQLVDGGRFLRRGMVYLVREVVWNSEFQELLLDVHAEYGAKAARRFRKVPPLPDDDLAEGNCAQRGVGVREVEPA